MVSNSHAFATVSVVNRTKAVQKCIMSTEHINKIRRKSKQKIKKKQQNKQQLNILFYTKIKKFGQQYQKFTVTQENIFSKIKKKIVHVVRHYNHCKQLKEEGTTRKID